jgi:non-heme chloroperoxidase
MAASSPPTSPEGSRRELLLSAAGATAAAIMPDVALAQTDAQDRANKQDLEKGTSGMDTITTRDGTKIFFKDWGSGQPIVFHHGWPLSGDDWDNQMLFFLSHGFRVIAHDRRGHGRSTQTANGNDMDTYAADVAELTTALDLHDAVHIGHSTGGGEVTRYVARHGRGRVAKAAHQCDPSGHAEIAEQSEWYAPRRL